MTPAERSLQNRIAAYILHSQVDGTAHTQKARDAFLAQFEAQVDPDGTLPVAERRRRALLARKAHMSRLALKSARARRAKKAARTQDAQRDEGGTSIPPPSGSSTSAMTTTATKRGPSWTD